MSERTEYLGKRAELRQRRLVLVTEGEALRKQLRAALPPDEDVGTLDGEVIAATAMSLGRIITDLTATDKRLAVLDRELGDAW